MSWLMKGLQSAIFHYASCTPCTGYMYKKQRRKQAKRARKARIKLELERPDLYHHPEPTGTNPYWQEEISIGPGPPPRRAKRANTGSTRAITTAGTHSTVVSQGGSSIDVNQSDDLRLSDETLDDDNWNRKRYQREDEDLWGVDELVVPLAPTMSGSSVGVAGITRPDTSSGSYYSARAPPVNDLHPPVVSLPSPHPSDNRWMLQPPPKASVMSGKERAKNRSRSGSGASSRVELSLQRQVSARQLRQKLDRGETPEMPPLSRGSSYSNLVAGQRHDRPKTPGVRPSSAASSLKKKRRDTAMTKTDTKDQSSGDSSDTIVRRTPTPKSSNVPGIKVVRVRTSRQPLSTVMSSGSGNPPSPTENISLNRSSENENNTAQRIKYSSTQSSDSIPYYAKHRPPLASSDVSSLNVLQDLVSPRALLNSRFVSAPLMEARIKLPPSNNEEEEILATNGDWPGSGFAISRTWGTDQVDGELLAPFDSHRVTERDPRMRWSVDF
ncbi:hypothetical protein BU26DRAFT_304246 [Trematosphaeria pertusa]|uniref:Signal peptide-containing protein n=1 Tax=Trematosphaeria pertusa TaxID=390896 RepID=A0A6A6IF44_9PLEO|nr:uncharacterized protein BU26DRAFT_304246 [Trematosphaeria pertusa]KAF2248698.1 hypothetical protein BU26DRAFT_304246 [Trematosphaeria pertusa]